MDHVTVYVTDLEAGTVFWSALLAPLGWEVGERDAEEVTLRGPHGTRFFLAPAAQPTSAVHLAFRARTPEEVRDFHAAGLALGCRDHGAPGLRPQYGADYYASFVLDAHGNNLEAVQRRT